MYHQRTGFRNILVSSERKGLAHFWAFLKFLMDSIYEILDKFIVVALPVGRITDKFKIKSLSKL